MRGNIMKHPFIEIGGIADVSGGFIEAMSETAVALTIAAAVCVGVTSLSVHLNEARNVHATAFEAAATPSGFAVGGIGATQLN
jgi:hypothetical protein